MPGGERRIGKRIRIAQLPASVRYVLAATRWWQRSHPAVVEGFVADMSMTGVGLLVPRSTILPFETLVNVEIDGCSAEAITRTCRAVDTAWLHYGLEFCPLPADFHEVVSDLVAGGHRDFDWQWDVAR